MNLPATYGDALELAARARADEFIAASQQGDFIELGCAPTHPEAGRRFLRRM